MTRPSRPIQASRAPGARWAYSEDGIKPWWSLASRTTRWGWVIRHKGNWEARVAHDSQSRFIGWQLSFATKRAAMRWLEELAIRQTRRLRERRLPAVWPDQSGNGHHFVRSAP